MKRFALGLGIGIFLGLTSVALALVFLFHAPSSIAGSTAEPVLLFENEQLKAWSLTLEPGQSTPIHTHQLDKIVICLESGKLRVSIPGPEPGGTTVQPKFGDVFMPKVKGVTHVLTNAGETRYRQVSIELKS